MSTPKTCSQITFLIFRHLWDHYFNCQGSLTLPFFLSKSINIYIVRLWTLWKYHTKKILSLNLLKFGFFSKKRFLIFFFNFYLMLEDPRKILMSKISNFFEQSSRYSQNHPKAPKILQELLSNSEELLSPRPTKLLKNSKRFQKNSKRFQKNPKDANRF